jgi:hypothetical protein
MNQQNKLVTFVLTHKLISFLIIAIALIGSFTLANQASKPKTNQKATTNTNVATKTSRVTKSGILVCLVQDEAKHPDVCTKTLKADDGVYYTIKEKDATKPLVTALYNTRIQVSGTLTTLNTNKNKTMGGTLTVEKYGEIQ